MYAKNLPAKLPGYGLDAVFTLHSCAPLFCYLGGLEASGSGDGFPMPTPPSTMPTAISESLTVPQTSPTAGQFESVDLPLHPNCVNVCMQM